MIEDREARLYCATFRIRRTVHQAGDASLNHGSRAHGAGFNRHIQFSAREAIVPEPLRCFAQRNHFGVRGGIAIGDSAVSGAGDDLIINYHHRADWDFSAFGRGAGFLQRGAHESRVVVIVWNIIDDAHFWQDSMEPLREFTRHKDEAVLATVTGQLPIH